MSPFVVAVLSKLKYYIKRFRVNRGFTVHSPFAFRFIRLVVREKHPYYAFRTIRDPYDRLLFRTAVFFNPATIAALGDSAPHALEIMRRALPAARIVDPVDADFIYSETPLPAAPLQFLKGRHRLPSHTVFALPGATIAYTRPGLPPAHYPLSLH